MTSTTSTLPAVSRAPAVREWGVDLVRGVALISMFVAHTAPSAGPGGVLQLSEYLTFPLFAVLVGVGAELSARRHGWADHLAGSLVRGLVLVALGWALVEAGAQVVIVLAPLGVLTLICWGLSLLPSTLVTGVGVLAWLAAPWSVQAGQEQRMESMMAGRTGDLRWLDLVVSTSYPQLVLVACAAVGIVALRLLRPRSGEPVPWQIGAVLTALLLVGCAVVLVLARADILDVVAYDTTHQTVAFVAALALGVLVAGITVGQVAFPALRRALAPVAWAGGMTLTLYSVHVLWLAYWVRVLHPGERDDTWINVVGMTVASLVLVTAWRVLPLSGAWRRGPLEGVVGSMCASVGRLFGAVASVSSPPPEGRSGRAGR